MAGSTVGLEHSRAAGCREDAYALSPSMSGTHTVIAVADGVGSSRLSHIASMVAAEVVVGLIAAAPVQRLRALLGNDGHWQRSVVRIAEEVAAALAPEMIDLRAAALADPDDDPRQKEPATTLACGILLPAQGGHDVLWFGVGDAGVGILRPGAIEPQWVSPQGSGADTRTDVLPGDVGKAWAGATFLDADAGLMVVTDGMYNVLRLNAGTTGNPELRDLAAAPLRTDLIVPVLTAEAMGEYDDRTFVLVQPLSSGA